LVKRKASVIVTSEQKKKLEQKVSQNEGKKVTMNPAVDAPESRNLPTEPTLPATTLPCFLPYKRIK